MSKQNNHGNLELDYRSTCWVSLYASVYQITDNKGYKRVLVARIIPMVQSAPLAHKPPTISHTSKSSISLEAAFSSFTQYIPINLDFYPPSTSCQKPRLPHVDTVDCVLFHIFIAMAFVPVVLLPRLSTRAPLPPINPVMVFAGASQWVRRRLRHLVQPLRTSSRSGLLALPQELTLMVTSHLDICSTTALALSCRAFYSLCYPGVLPRDSAEKKALLLLLEKDIATHYFCHDCVKLHRWHARWSRSRALIDCPTPCKRYSGARNQVFLLATCDLPYYYARLVMNRHLYGAAHGPPLSELEQPARPCRYPEGIISSEAQQARIVDGQLLIMSAVSYYHERGDATTLRYHIDSLGGSVCSHVNIWKGDDEFGLLQLPELAASEAGGGTFSTCDQTFGACAFCLSDYSISISLKGKKGYIIEVASYRQLGDCRSPDHWSWRNVSTMATLRDLHTARPSEYGPGCIRDRWNSADAGAKSSHRGRSWMKC